MPLPVIADVFRCAINWRSDSFRTATNVIHVLVPTADEEDVASVVFDSMNANMWQCVSARWDINDMVVTKLDGTPDGISFPSPEGADFDGHSSNEYFPQASALIKLGTTQTGKSGRGRVYLPALGEASQVDGFITSGDKGTTTSGWNGFRASLLAATPQAVLVVASYTLESASVVLSSECERETATQRRRNRRT